MRILTLCQYGKASELESDKLSFDTKTIQNYQFGLL